jgi:hypothetical protein
MWWCFHLVTLSLAIGSFRTVLIDDEIRRLVDTVRPDAEKVLTSRGNNVVFTSADWDVHEAAVQIVRGRKSIVRVTESTGTLTFCLTIYDEFGKVSLESVEPCESWLDVAG